MSLESLAELTANDWELIADVLTRFGCNCVESECFTGCEDDIERLVRLARRMAERGRDDES